MRVHCSGDKTQLQPAPLIAVATIVPGKVSLTVTVPAVAPKPMLRTESVNFAPTWFLKKLLMWDLVIDKSGPATFSVACATCALLPAFAVVTLPAARLLVYPPDAAA